MFVFLLALLLLRCLGLMSFVSACIVLPCVCFFFFSSRRRHTRYWRDWSSDVCSSDLFRFRNISPRAHELVADLLRAGVVPAEVHERINRRGTIQQLNIVGLSLANARRHGEALVSTVDNDDYARTEATEIDSKEAIDQLRSVAGIDVVAHLRQVPEGTKGSLRSETVDVGEIARLFGGGGHKLAAGYTRRGMRPHEAKEELLDVLAERLDLGGTR